jgi:hypothetical protein
MSLVLLLPFFLAGTARAQSDLVITGVVDGPLSGGTPKAVELYVLNDIADLSSYGLAIASNGGGSDGAPEYTFPDSAATAGDYLYIASDSTQFNAFFGFDPLDAGPIFINGDDAVELYQDGTVVDVFGDINTDGSGEAWEYLDGWAYRVDGTGPDGSMFGVGNWTYSGADALDGETTNASATTPFPIGTYSPEGGAAEAMVTFADQSSEGLTVAIASVFVPEGGYVAIHDASLLEGDALGSVIGVSDFLAAGTYTDLMVTLFDVPGLDVPSDTSLTEDQTLIAMPHRETNGNETYDFLTSEGSDDGPYFIGNDSEQGAVTDDAVITITEPLALTFTATLSGAAEVPAVETSASGTVSAALNGSQLTVTGTFTGLESDYNQAIGSHIHGAAPGANGGVRFALDPTLDGDLRGGTFEAEANTFTLTSAQVDSLIAGLYYVNVHSVDNPSGEIRGQLVLPIAEARTLGTGTTVGVRGTVTRAMGDFTYFQDETGGLTIRQPSGAFFDAVADGSIGAGTVVVVSGELSEFASLLQINEDDLGANAVVGMTDVPEPQEVTVAELLANGEAYEAELVTVAGLDTEATGTFEDGENYAVTDASTETPITLRIPNAEDSEVDGTAIPDGEFTFTGVVAQFDFDDPAAGYQLLAIEATDIMAGTVSNEDGAALPAAFAVGGNYPNPFAGQTTLRVDLPADAEVSVEVYDVLGRRVLDAAPQAVAAGSARTFVLDAPLASGTYIYRVTAEMAGETESATGRMTIVR